MIPVECVARGYLTGSGLADYQRDGVVAGFQLPPGLMDGSRLPAPIFDPDSKAPTKAGYRIDGDKKVRVSRASGKEV